MKFFLCVIMLNAVNAGLFNQISLNYSSIPVIHIGVSTSSYQIEGAWNIDGRSPSIWDDFVHQTPSLIRDHSNGDTTCNSYFLIDRDIEMLKQLSVNSYRMSLSWSRLFPNDLNTINTKALVYYRTLFQKLLENNITPFVTLFHWDLPSYLQSAYGGWASPLIIEDFITYANQVYELFSDLVSNWITINEPYTFVTLGYQSGAHAPGFRDLSMSHDVALHLLQAHNAVYRSFHKKQGFDGRVSISLNSDYWFAKSDADKNTANQILVDHLGWFADPLLFGNSTIFTENVTPLKGSLDFFALNHYSSFCVDGKNKYGKIQGSIETASSWLLAYPKGLLELTGWIQNRYRLKIPIIITESGVSNHPWDSDDDDFRIAALSGFYRSLYESVEKYRANVTHYFIWSLMDNFEWAAGFTERFGLFHTDFETKNCHPKKSVSILFH